MSYELKIDPKKRAGGRFIGAVRKALIMAALEEKHLSGVTQQKVANSLGVNRSVINRMLRGDANLSLRSVAEIAWALGWVPVFSMQRLPMSDRQNCPPEPTATSVIHRIETGSKSDVVIRYANPPASTSTRSLILAE